MLLLEESLSQLTHRIASCFPYSAVGKVPGDTEHILDYIMESDRLQARRYLVEGWREWFYQKSLLFLWAPWFHLVHSVVFFQTVIPSVKVRVCEDMSMPVFGGFIQGKNFVAHSHSYTIVEPLMDLQLNGAHSQAVQSPFKFFPPLEPCCSRIPVLSLINFWWAFFAFYSHDGWLLYMEFLHGVYLSNFRLMGVGSRIWHLWYLLSFPCNLLAYLFCV